MHCPNCGTEYPEGVRRCSACDVELLDAGAATDETEWVSLVTVLETADPSLLMVAKSLLDAEHIPSFAEGEGPQEGLGAGRIAESDIPMGPGRLKVRAEHLEAARELLASLQPLGEADGPQA